MRRAACLFTALVLPACGGGGSDGGGPPPPAAPVSFSTQIWPILMSRCQSCHNPAGSAATVGLDYTNATTAYSSWFDTSVMPPTGRASSTCPTRFRIVPFDSTASFVHEKLRTDTPQCGSRMPLGGPYLSAAEQDLFRDWIDQGAQDN